MKQPLLLPVVGVICGILAGNWIESPLYLLAFIPVIFVFIKWFRQHLLVLCLFFISWANHDFHYYLNSYYDLRTIFKDKAAIVTVRGKINGLLSEKYIKSKTDKISTKFNLDCSEIFLDNKNQWLKVDGKVLVFINGRLSEDYFDGQLIEAKGVIKPPLKERIFGLFNYQKHLWNKYIYYIFQIDSTNEIKVVSYGDYKPSLTFTFGKWAIQTLRRGLPDETSNSDIRQAMMFGWKSLLKDDISNNFIRSGTMHLFAVSGSNISLLSGAMMIILRAFCIPRIICGIIIIPAMWFFTAVTGWEASAIRATVMLTIIVVGWMFSRPSDLLNSLFAAAILILLWQPSQLFQAGFQLSFMVVLSLALFLPFCERMYEWLTQNDPFLPKELQPLSTKMINPVIRYSGGAIGTSFAAFIGSFPLIAYYFNIVSLISVIANLVVIPLSALCLISSLGSIATGFWWQGATELLNWSGWFWSKCMVYFTEYFSSFNYGWFYITKPSTSLILFYYFILICLATKIFYKPKIRIYFTVISAIWLSSLFYDYVNYANTIELNIMSFQRGHSIYVDKRFSENCLIDCGSDYDIRT
ncbi:MAG TPA: ComEC/Rec2 family competence protein, partial [Verrucomicrobiota bacterium]|nr:ComEC/Rec2 family competence protein [Verrucomicrobiota bacterium]